MSEQIGKGTAIFFHFALVSKHITGIVLGKESFAGDTRVSHEQHEQFIFGTQNRLGGLRSTVSAQTGRLRRRSVVQLHTVITTRLVQLHFELFECLQRIDANSICVAILGYCKKS